MRSLFVVMLISFYLINCEGPVGPQGPQGYRGTDGIDGSEVSVITGTIYNVNYTEGNPSFVSINLPSASNNHAIIFFGIENLNQVYVMHDWSSTIYGGGDSDYSVKGVSGYYLLCYDEYKSLATKKYQIKYIK